MPERRSRHALALLVLALLVTACASSRTSDKVLVFIDPPDAEALLGGGGGILGIGGGRRVAWVDPRRDSHHEQAHIAGAIHIPFQSVATRHTELLAYDLLIVYGDDYNDPIAEAMSKRLVELGHGDVRTLRGGLRAWKAAGHEVVGEAQGGARKLTDGRTVRRRRIIQARLES